MTLAVVGEWHFPGGAIKLFIFKWLRKDRPPLTITPDTPLRLAQAAELAFPGGGIKAWVLRKERGAGRLRTWLVAGKEFSTLADIEAMNNMCKQATKVAARPASAPKPNPYRQAEIALAAALVRCEKPAGEE